MYARVVFAFLIDAQGRVKFLHQARIAVTLAAVGRDVERLWLSEVTLSGVLCTFLGVSVGVAAVTIVARQAASPMNVVIEKFGGGAQSRIIQLHMALNAGTLLLC